MIKNTIIVGLGGFAGAIARYFVNLGFNAAHATAFPWATLFVNITGSTALGILVGLNTGQLPYLIFGVGFLGAFTTFSTFSLDTLQLFESSGLFFATFNIFLNLFFCIAGLYCGRTLLPLIYK